MLQAHLGVLRVDAAGALGAPAYDIDAGVIGTGSTGRDYLMPRLAVLLVLQGVVADGQAVEGVSVRLGVAVEKILGCHLGEALHKGSVLASPEALLVLLQGKELNIHIGAVLQNNAGILHLLGGALGTLHTAVNLADGRSRQAGADGGNVARRQVAFLPPCILQDRVGLFQRLNDKRRRAVRGKALLVVRHGKCLSA